MKINDNFVKVDVGGEVNIIPVGEASKDKNGVFTLNETAAVIYEAIESGKDPDEIAAMLVEKYDADISQAEEYVNDFISELKKAGILID